MRVKQGCPVHLRVMARRPATGRLESEAVASVQFWEPGALRDSQPHYVVPLAWDPAVLRYCGRAETTGWVLGGHQALATVRDVGGSLLGTNLSTVDVVPAD